MANKTNIYLFYKDNNLIAVKVIGHANFDEYGKDIVCASISSIIFGFMNAVEVFDTKIDIDKKNACININFNQSSQKINDYGELLLIQLKTISHIYSKNLKITIRKE